MTNENDLMMKLVAAKQIMNKHNEIGRGGIPTSIAQVLRVSFGLKNQR
jgi:hypothetical protein